MLASTKSEVVESGGGNVNLDVWKWDASTESEESGQEDDFKGEKEQITIYGLGI